MVRWIMANQDLEIHGLRMLLIKEKLEGGMKGSEEHLIPLVVIGFAFSWVSLLSLISYNKNSPNFVSIDRTVVCYLGLGTDEKTIVSVLGHRSASQRIQIRQAYYETYGEDLFKSLDKEISGDFEVLLDLVLVLAFFLLFSPLLRLFVD